MLREMYEKRGLMQIWDSEKISWEERRKEIVALLCKEEYGFFPAKHEKISFEVLSEDVRFCAGKSTLYKVKVSVSFGKKEFSFPIYANIPKKEGKHPFFVHINFTDGVPDKCLPIEEICDRGFAVISFSYRDVTEDDVLLTVEHKPKSNELDLYEVLFERKAAPETMECGKIAFWAWAASRAMDYAETLDCLDLTKAAVVGHSRLGKTALLAGALDERFRYVISNDSGCSGAAISRDKVGESIERITTRFFYWFCKDYYKYRAKEQELPFDQHFLIAASAPRKVYVASAVEDTWADPDSEYLACYAASEVYEKLGMKGFVCPDRLPQVGDVLQEGNILYHLRSGCHYFSREDWGHYMDYLLQD